MELKRLVNQTRTATSQVKRLRVAAGSDPERAPELADSLIELTGLRLAGWQFGEAAADAPEAVLVAARILAARGPVGPYAALSDVLRYVSATVQLAAVQSGLGQPDAAARLLDDLDGWLGQVSRLPVSEGLPAPLHAWAVVARARAALPVDVALANAWADAAELVLHSADLPAYLAVAVHLLSADCRWAAGRPEAALAHHLLALQSWEAVTAEIDSGSRPALRALALAPLTAVHDPYAERLRSTGDAASSIAARRAELAQAERLGAPAELLQSLSLTLAAALAAAGRQSEAVLLAGPQPVPDLSAVPLPGRVEWNELAPSGLRQPTSPQAPERWRQAEQRAAFERAARRATAESSERTLQVAAEAALMAAQAEREQAEQEQAAAKAAADRRREELARAHRLAIDPVAARQAAANLDRAREAVAAAGDDLSVAAAAHQDLAVLLRPLVGLEPARRDELVAVLEALVGLRWRLGDPEASRAAAREARALGEGT